MGGRCLRTVLDCRRVSSKDAGPLVALDLSNISKGFIGCPPSKATASSSGFAIVYHSGPDGRCSLADPDNAYGCFWNALTQQFEQSPGVDTPCARARAEQLQCMCRGLPIGDFKGSSAVKIRVASLSEIKQLTPRALSTQLRTLLSLSSSSSSSEG